MNTVPCKYCSTPTPMTGTELCESCWELERRIEMNLELAEKILREKKSENK